MKNESFQPVDRGEEELQAAHLLADGGFFKPAISRAYFAAFYAAEAALLAVGQTRSKHSGVIAAFGQEIIRGDSFGVDTGRLLPSLFERRNAADSDAGDMTAADAVSAINDAERFVAAVKAWRLGRPG